MICECNSRTLSDCGTQVEVTFTMMFSDSDRVKILDAIRNNKLVTMVSEGLKSIEEVKE